MRWLLGNPGFELGDASGWDGTGSTITANSTEKRSGQYGGYVSGRSAEWQGAWLNGLHTVLTPGKTYRVSLWIKPAAGSDITVELTSKQTNGGADVYGPVLQRRVCPAGKWSELSGGFTFTNPGNTSALSFYVYSLDPTRSYAVDDAEVRIDELTVDLAVTGAPVTQKATGFLHGLGDTAPSAAHYELLKPRIQRFAAFLANPNMLGIPTGFGSPAYMNRLKSVGAKQQVLLSDEYMWFGHHTSWGWPGDPAHDGYTSFQILDQKIDSLVDHALANFPSSQGWQIEWDIWNEPDADFFWGRSQAQFFETWKHAWQKIRAKDPNAVIVGPSIAFFVTQGANPEQGGWLKQFLIYARDNNVLPDIVTWHEMVNPKEIPAQVELVREFMAANGIPDRPIDVNEYQGPGENLMLSPGNTISFLSSFESTDIRHAIRACWNEDVAQTDGATNGLHPGRLDNIMTQSPFQPRAQWHVYRSYAEMSGSIVPINRGGFLSGLATKDVFGGKAHILVGNDGTNSFSTNVTIRNLTQLTNLTTTGEVRVRVREIPFSGLNALGAPTQISNTILTPVGDTLVVPLTVNPRGAYEITLQTIGPKTASSANGNWSNPASWTNGVPALGGASGIVHTMTFQAGDSWTGGLEEGLLIGYDSWGGTWGLSGNGSGTLNVTGGNLTTGFLGLGAGLNGGNQTGTLNISGGTVTVNGPMRVGWSTTMGSSLNVGGGVLNLNGEDNVIGYGATATMTVTGGTVHLNRPISFNNSSTLTIGSTGLFNINSAGTLTASATIQSGGTLRYNGGSGNAGSNLVVQGGTVDVNGQALPTGTWANWLPGADGNRLLNSSTTPAVIANGNTLWLWNTPSMNTTIETVGDLTIHAWITGSGGHNGGITKTGAATLTVTNPGNDYTGHTVVNAGTLRFNHPTLANAADVRITSGAFLNLNFLGTDTIRSFYVNGIKQASGTWGAVGSTAQHRSALITGTGIIAVSTGANFSSWSSENGIGPAAPRGDYDGDGIANLMEYALGLSPTNPSGKSGIFSGSTITFSKGAAAVENGDVAYAIETSTTLASDSWVRVTPTEDSSTQISYTLPSGVPKIFVRLKATQAP